MSHILWLIKFCKFISCKGFYCQKRSPKRVQEPEVKSLEPEVTLDPSSPSKLQNLFYHWTNFVQNHPFLIIFISISFILFMMSGLIFIDFTTDPIKLWTSSESRSYKEYVKYNKYFGPFYRTQQIIASLKPDYDSLPGRDDWHKRGTPDLGWYPKSTKFFSTKAWFW